jgi:hypothetical protein
LSAKIELKIAMVHGSEHGVASGPRGWGYPGLAGLFNNSIAHTYITPTECRIISFTFYRISACESYPEVKLIMRRAVKSHLS